MVEDFCAERAIHSAETMLKVGPRYGSPTVGVVERAKSRCHWHHLVNLSLSSVLRLWRARHVGWIYTKFGVGRGCGGTVVEIGESVLATIFEEPAKLDPRWVQGMWLGKDEKSDNITVNVDSRKRKYRTAERLPEIQR